MQPNHDTRIRKSRTFAFAATCATGLEKLVAQEMSQCGAENPRVSPGAITWTAASLASAYRACLWSRFASRILLELARFDATNTDALYAHAGEVLWDEHLSLGKTFAVSCTLVNSAIDHSQFAALRVKDAIVDQFRRRFGRRPNVDTLNPSVRLHLHIQGSSARLSLDLSGDSLHRRGYRQDTGAAPLKETLAAALVRLSGWLDHVDAEPVLLDPMCGGGTILIEAALMLMGSAPGLTRKRFGFMGWNRHDASLWEHLVAEALEKEGTGGADKMPQFIGYDADPRAMAAARKNVIAAGLRDLIVIHQRELARLQSPARAGCIITNPPYGERLSDRESARYLYRALGRCYRERFPGWRLAFFTANPEFADVPAVLWEQEHQLFNGPLKCRLLVGHESRPALPEKTGAVAIWQPRALAPGSAGEDFANRLRKNFAALSDWLEREQVSCFRLYDADLPDFNFAVDCYEEWIQVQEYGAPAGIDENRALERRQTAIAVLREVMGAERDQIFIKTRRRQKGPGQYQRRHDKPGRLFEVREGGGRFLVNFTDYLDTGLFLDHRPIRRRIRELAAGRSFLNLFGYTGTATVFAALGGASATTTVDASESYLARAAANLALNGLGGPLHQLVQADCLSWIRESQEQYGLIFVDPPTFSNSKSKLPESRADSRGGQWQNGKSSGKWADRDAKGGRWSGKDGRPGKWDKGPAGKGERPGQFRTEERDAGRETRATFDIQRDHGKLLHLAMQHLSPGGLLIFSTNFRKFELEARIAQEALVEEISAATIPPDFRRNPRIHRVWEFRQK